MVELSYQPPSRSQTLLEHGSGLCRWLPLPFQSEEAPQNGMQARREGWWLKAPCYMSISALPLFQLLWKASSSIATTSGPWGQVNSVTWVGWNSSDFFTPCAPVSSQVCLADSGSIMAITAEGRDVAHHSEVGLLPTQRLL